MEMKLIVDKNGNGIYPITHMGAVRDNNGNTVANVLENHKELIDGETARATAAEQELAASIANINNTSSNSISAESNRARQEAATLRNQISNLNDSVALLNGNDVLVVDDHSLILNPDETKIYRETGTSSYTDYMYSNGTWKQIAEYSFPGIDSNPVLGSQNLITSGGVAQHIVSMSSKLNEIEDLIKNTTEEGFAIVDANGNIGLKYDENGLDAALLSTHLISLLESAIGGSGIDYTVVGNVN